MCSLALKVWDEPIPPASHLIAEDSDAASASDSYGPFSHHSPLVTVEIGNRCLLDDVSGLREQQGQCRMEKFHWTTPVDPRRKRLVHATR